MQMKKRWNIAMLTYKTVWSVDRFYFLYTIVYNLLKQFFNVFYSVYFLRTLLAYIENGQSVLRIVALLLFMACVEIVFYHLDNHLKQVYFVNFETKLKENVNENIFRAARSAGYEAFCDPKFLNQYRQVLDNTAVKMAGVAQTSGAACGLCFALGLVLVYLVKVDLGAILFCLFSLVYSFLAGSIGEKIKYTFNHATTEAERKKEYARRIFYLPKYAKDLRMYAESDLVEGIYEEGTEEIIREQKRFGGKLALFSFLEACIGDAVIVLFPIAYVAVRILSGAQMLVGDFVGIAQSVAILGWDVEMLLDQFVEIGSSLRYVQDYEEFLAAQEEKTEDTVVKTGKIPGKNDSWVLECQNAGYQYASGKKALHDVCLEIHSGEKIAVVGENGAGKTTLASLLVNLFPCQEGSVVLNGSSLSTYSRRDLNRFSGVVSQDFQIYPLSVRENLCVNGPVSDNILWKSLEKMGLKEKIPDLDRQMTHEFSDEGLLLSGGQMQRLALARVVANDFPFLILDEPTSALDPITEREIDRLLLQAAEDRTVLIISHRLATTRLVDRILVMKGGTIVESGSHNQLIEQQGVYWNMYMAHQELYGAGLSEMRGKEDERILEKCSE